MTLEQFMLTAELQTILLGLLAILCFIRYRSRSVIVRLIGFNSLVGLMANVSSWLLIQSESFRAYSNSPAVVYFVVSMTILSYLYLVILINKKIVWFISVTAALTVLAFVNFYYIQKTAVNSNIYVVYAGALICYSLWYFYVLIRDLPSLYVYQMPMFWFNSAFLISGAGTFFLFSFTSYLINVLKNDLITYWSFHNMLSIFAYMIVLVGLFYDFRQINATRKRTMHQRI